MVLLKNQNDTESLEDLFVTFAHVILAQMISWVEQGEDLTYVYEKISFTEEGGYTQVLETVRDYLMLLQRHNEFILAMEAADNCARRYWESGLFRFPQNLTLPDGAGSTLTSPTFEQVRSMVIQDLIFTINDICTRCNTLQPTDEQMIEQYQRIKELWTATTIQVDVTFPLLNFRSDLQQEYRIGTQLHLAPFPSEEKTVVWNEGGYDHAMIPKPMELHIFATVQFKLSGVRHQVKDMPVGTCTTEGIVNELGNVLTAFRLLKQGDIGAPAIFEKDHTSSVWQTPALNRSLNDYRVRQLQSIYTLSETDLPTLETLLNELHTLNIPQRRSGKQKAQRDTQKPYGDLAVALRRFNQAYGRDVREDQIIDLTVALERCLLADTKEELNYKFALRGAAVLARIKAKDWNPHKSHLLLKVMYDARSAIVHDGKQLADLEEKLKVLHDVGIPPQNFVQECENIVRLVLRAYVTQVVASQSPKEIVKDLDRYIVDSLATLFDAEI